ncbi:MAG: RHS repeat-associated core domain-containing protein [Saprospiraceae bacterium]|nr:RHS repeat-associated core domain-containing protein [Saprospiraceae bacterium]
MTKRYQFHVDKRVMRSLFSAGTENTFLGGLLVRIADKNGDGKVKYDVNNPANDELLSKYHYYPSFQLGVLFGDFFKSSKGVLRWNLEWDTPIFDQNGNSLSETGVENRYTYNGKEYIEDLSINLHDYGARYYDPSIARWTSVDPLADFYSSFSSFNYTLGNPVRFVDTDGMRVDLSALYTNKDGSINEEGLITASNILLELQEFTGLELTVKDGFLIEGTSTKNCSGSEVCGSTGARKYVRDLIDSPDVLTVVNDNSSDTRALEDKDGNAINTISINNRSAEYTRDYLNYNGADELGWSYATDFLHESLHTPLGASQIGKTSKEMEHIGGSPGPISVVNSWRKENVLPTRRNHGPKSKKPWDKEWVIDVPGRKRPLRIQMDTYKKRMNKFLYMSKIILYFFMITCIYACNTKNEDIILMKKAKVFLEKSILLKETYPEFTGREYSIGIYDKQYGPLLFGFEDKIIKCLKCKEILEKNRFVNLDKYDSWIKEFDKIGVEYRTNYGSFNVPNELVDSTKNILVSFRKPISGVLGGILFLKNEFGNEEKPYAEFTLFYNNELEIVEIVY